MNEPKNHHFIPILHLQHFIGAEPKGHVWTYEKMTGDIRSSIPAETGFETHFYSVQKEDGSMDTSIEKHLAAIEGKAAPVYQELLRGQIPTDPQQRMDFAHFLALMHVRTPAMRRMIGKMHGQQAQVMRYAYGSHPKAFEGLKRRIEKDRGETMPAEIEALIKEKLIDPSGYEVQVSKESTLHILGAADKIAPILEKMKWSLFQPKHGFFISSDNPLVRDCDPKTKHPIYGDQGFANPTNEIIFPLSPQRLLFMCFDSRKPDHLIVNREYVELVNKGIAANSDRYLYAHLKHKAIAALAKEFEDSRPDMTMQGFGPDKFAPTKVVRRFKP